MNDEQIRELEEKLKLAKAIRNKISSYEIYLDVLNKNNYVRGLKLKILHGSSAEAEFDLEIEDRHTIIPIIQKRLEELRLELKAL